jgi:hypothetical protein
MMAGKLGRLKTDSGGQARAAPDKPTPSAIGMLPHGAALASVPSRKARELKTILFPGSWPIIDRILDRVWKFFCNSSSTV